MARVTTAFLFLASTAGAQACPSFGLETAYLSEFFCREFGEVSGPATRNMGTGSGEQAENAPPEWIDLPVVSEAWRVDPAATLELIERIRAAGGRPIN